MNQSFMGLRNCLVQFRTIKKIQEAIALQIHQINVALRQMFERLGNSNDTFPCKGQINQKMICFWFILKLKHFGFKFAGQDNFFKKDFEGIAVLVAARIWE